MFLEKCSLRRLRRVGDHRCRTQVFYDYPFPSQPDPIPAGLMPSYVTSAPNIDYPSHESDAIGIQQLAQTNNTFAIRFSGAFFT